MNIELKAKKLFKNCEIEIFGSFCKIKDTEIENNNNKSKLILVTSINPTPSGEGKTTTLIGINDSLNYFNISSVACLRQPSMGPFFGIKGGATGSGESEILNAEKINCGFTGDFYEIEAATNLIYAVIENEIYFNSSLNIDKDQIFWKRCVDVNDRSLREINYKLNKFETISTGFTITAASNLMALFCLSINKKDFKEKLNNTIIALNKEKKPIYIKDLGIIDSLMMILDRTLNPNLAISKYKNPILIHGGPFANIAHGCNSVIATNLALKNFDYVLTEAGFGSDLGTEKFLNIKCRSANLIPNLVVLSITLKALKHHGSFKNELSGKDLINEGFKNVLKHITNIKNFNLNLCIVINKFSNDDIEELNYLKSLCLNYADCEISNMWSEGPSTSKNICDMILKNCKENKSINFTYNLSEETKEKINKICFEIYGAKKVTYSEIATKRIEELSDLIKGYYICNAKTPFSLSADPLLLNKPENFEIFVSDIEVNHASKFVIPILSKIFLMPGLPKEANAKKIKYEIK